MDELNHTVSILRRFKRWPDQSKVTSRDGAQDQIQQLQQELHIRDRRIAALIQSTSWRVTAPLRFSKIAVSARGWRAFCRISRDFVRAALAGNARMGGLMAIGAFRRAMEARRPVVKTKTALQAYSTTISGNASDLIAPRILIAAESSIQQCVKYRVRQKQSLVQSLGADCTVIEWWRHDDIRSALQTHSILIMYRVPGYQDTIDDIGEAKRLGVSTIWEVDDLIFDEDAYRANRNIDLLEPALKESVLYGVPLFRAALQACDHGIATTAALAAAMREAGAKETFIIENGLDEETLSLAESILATRANRHADRAVTIMYGSGSKAHNADFEAAGAGILQALRERPQLRLRIVGELVLPTEFDPVSNQIERLAGVDFASYMRLLGEADISIAPLEAGLFNEAKSNIKFIEAAVLGLPSICSPRESFARVISSGCNGYLADTAEQWAEAVRCLVDREEHRLAVGKAARDTVLAEYLPEVIATRQVASFLHRFSPPRTDRPRVLIVNIFFSPQSFGGATVVAEEVAKRLKARSWMDVAIFTSWGDPAARPYDVKRFEVFGIPVIAVRLPDDIPPGMQFRNPNMGRVFADVLRAVRPDIVHFHSIQGLGGELVQACLDVDLPYVVTLHDAWWICERQFMVRSDGHYCFQDRIEWSVCSTCVPDLGFSIRRSAYLSDLLDGAAKVLTPSAFHRDLHVANGIAPGRIVVNRNGVTLPAIPRPPREDQSLIRFGFVGGGGPIKGLDLIRSAFEGLTDSNYELTLVDNTLNLGFSTIQADAWKLRGRVRVVPAYTAATMDAFFNSIDVLLFPSRWKESFGLTVREALARDVWVILTNSGGAVEDIVEGENGTVIPIGDDPAPLRDAIAGFLRDANRLSGYTNRHASRIATFDTQADELTCIYRDVLVSQPIPKDELAPIIE